MPGKYQNIIFRVSTPNGPVEVGWRMENKTRRSKIVCLLCNNCFVDTEKELAKHVRKDHPLFFRFSMLANWKTMIV